MTTFSTSMQPREDKDLQELLDKHFEYNKTHHDLWEKDCPLFQLFKRIAVILYGEGSKITVVNEWYSNRFEEILYEPNF